MIDKIADRNPGCEVDYAARMVNVIVREYENSICVIPACFATPAIRSASRAPGQPASINNDCPEGETSSVDCPPSTSMK